MRRKNSNEKDGVYRIRHTNLDEIEDKIRKLEGEENY